MNIEIEPPALVHPLVSEANIASLSWGRILSDGLLRRQLRYIQKTTKPSSAIHKHATWLYDIFPSLETAPETPSVWNWDQLTAAAKNIGTAADAEHQVRVWNRQRLPIAYWTGGLELTKNHHHVAYDLLHRGYAILLGVEPEDYPSSTGKLRGTIEPMIIPISFWSKLLGERGYIFEIPRPRPDTPTLLDGFYESLYTTITQGKASIVVSRTDSYSAQKLSRGKTVQVRQYDYPRSTQLWKSIFS